MCVSRILLIGRHRHLEPRFLHGHKCVPYAVGPRAGHRRSVEWINVAAMPWSWKNRSAAHVGCGAAPQPSIFCRSSEMACATDVSWYNTSARIMFACQSDTLLEQWRVQRVFCVASQRFFWKFSKFRSNLNLIYLFSLLLNHCSLLMLLLLLKLWKHFHQNCPFPRPNIGCIRVYFVVTLIRPVLQKFHSLVCFDRGWICIDYEHGPRLNCQVFDLL